MFKPAPEHIHGFMVSHFECKPRKGGIELCINNPFDGDTGHNFNVNVQKATCHDWRSDGWADGRSRTFMRFVCKYLNCSYKDAIKAVSGDDVASRLASIKFDDIVEPVVVEHVKLPDGSKRLIDASSMMSKILFKWLRSRGVDREMVEQYDIHYSGTDVVWPYYEFDELVYYQCRDRMSKVFKFPSSSIGVSKGMFVYGFDMVRPSTDTIITESIFCAMTLGSQCVATGGASMTPLQVRKIRALNPKDGVILSPDNDEAGIKSLMHNFDLLKPYFKIFYSLPPKVYNGVKIKDWNELFVDAKLSFNDIKKLYSDSIKPLDFSELFELLRS